MAVRGSLRLVTWVSIAPMATACAQSAASIEADDAAARTETSVAADDATRTDTAVTDARASEVAIDSTVEAGPSDAPDQGGDMDAPNANTVAADGAEEGDSNEDAPDPYACPTMAYPLRVRCAPDGGECSGPCDGCECGQSCTCYGGYWGCTPRCCTTSCAFDSGEDR